MTTTLSWASTASDRLRLAAENYTRARLDAMNVCELSADSAPPNFAWTNPDSDRYQRNRAKQWLDTCRDLYVQAMITECAERDTTITSGQSVDVVVPHGDA